MARSVSLRDKKVIYRYIHENVIFQHCTRVSINLPQTWSETQIGSFFQQLNGQLLSYQTGEFVNDRWVKLNFQKPPGSNTDVLPVARVEPQMRDDNYVDLR